MMSKKASFALCLLVLLVVANVFMVMGYTNYPSNARREGFANYLLGSAPTGSAYQPIGTYDNIVKAGMAPGQWKLNTPNEPKLGQQFEVNTTGPMGTEELFLFKNNQVKPECCGASFSCSGGCVCTTERDRELIQTRGGNRTAPGDF